MGPYEPLTLGERICPLCNGGIGNLPHVLTSCPMYDLRTRCTQRIEEDQKILIIFQLTGKCAAFCQMITVLR